MKNVSEGFTGLEGFEWDEWNIRKNWDRHQASHIECEEIFFNRPFIIKPDQSHSTKEDRYFALGKTDTGRLLFIVFTIRTGKIRVISARAMNRKERKIYEEIEKNPQV